MADLAREPSMEDILASIKRIIADDGAAATAPPARLRRGPVEVPPAGSATMDEVLELTEPVAPAPVTQAPPPSGPRLVPPPVAEAPAPAAPELVSEQAASASRLSLAALSALIVSPAAEPARDNTLEGLVREMLRPMLKEWLDARLPEMVEGLVAREIARITGRQL
ncbi:DUF2497 domain-containing protein [Sphingomonas jatrophae]|uniref:DUF2497 domain-containing protein n=1 Tax=Sphingomonas jatrophae TaxID=1166337 RepID=A0A1I6JT90_9SPHN|nr:DUF2497 domain-containing protein [Sphingomonas jatrophae]SFR82176.1 hypothetical protein SAMN05192580_0828 [Sphingomonas jatrophae]